ncbi:MAG: hypothetical protein M3P95_02305 [Actinomycetota bacterium]|nr:hypothetical protein [Actinomycetota bacterium]
MSDAQAEQGRHQQPEDPRAQAAEAVKRQREADTAESTPSGDSAALPEGAPSPPPGAQP